MKLPRVFTVPSVVPLLLLWVVVQQCVCGGAGCHSLWWLSAADAFSAARVVVASSPPRRPAAAASCLSSTGPYTPPAPSQASAHLNSAHSTRLSLQTDSNNEHNNNKQSSSSSGSSSPSLSSLFDHTTRTLQSAVLSLALGLSLGTTFLQPLPAAASADPKQIVGCLLQKCPTQLASCIANPKCLLNVACINTCTGRPDEIDCQIKCGDQFENSVVGDFNKCVVSDMQCVPQQKDDGSYPVPARSQTVSTFDTKFFNGKLYITAGQNPLFDIFPCQVHFFTETAPGQFFGKLNWRVTEPDGEFFTRDALQEFTQDKQDPSHLLNHDNEYLHYQDDWWVLDYEYDNNKDGVPPFALIYYRGSNDAWDGYGGAFLYTRDAQMPESLRPRLQTAAARVNMDFNKDFTVTDNSCPTAFTAGEKLVLREKFAGKVALQTEQQVQAAATRLRGNAVNSVKAQKLFFENRLGIAEKAFQELQDGVVNFESEASKK